MPDREILREQIAARVEAMYTGGLLEEVASLVRQGWNPLGTAAQAIGYAEALGCLAGTLSRADAMVLTGQRTRQLAKRQMTWFRHQAAVAWIPVARGMSVDLIADRVEAEWRRLGPQPVMLDLA